MVAETLRQPHPDDDRRRRLREFARLLCQSLHWAYPPDVELELVSRTVGESSLVDEFIFRFTHTTRMDWMLPGIEPTGRKVERPVVAVVKFQADKLAHPSTSIGTRPVCSFNWVCSTPTDSPWPASKPHAKCSNAATLPSNTLMEAAQ